MACASRTGRRDMRAWRASSGATRTMRCALVSATSHEPSAATLTEPGSFSPSRTVRTSVTAPAASSSSSLSLLL
jgi:hypothetical protein